ncbi:MAG: hypothetical protein ACK587_12295 [Cyanobacteriota bacterium]
MGRWIPLLPLPLALRSLACGTMAALLLQAAATGQPPPGRFAGSSRYWRPDYAGHLRMRSSGAIAFTAEAEVELQRLPESFPGSGIQNDEMRGLITLTSPLQLNQNGISTTCQILKPVVPVRIRDSGLTLYVDDEEFPRNSYEIRLFQEVPIGAGVSSDGRRETSPFQFMEVTFDSSQMAIDGRPPEAWKPPTPPKPLTPAEQAVADEQVRVAEAMTTHPAMQQGVQELVARAQREGRAITEAEALALMERLRRQGVIPERVPSFSAEREAELRRLGGGQGKIDVSHLRRTPGLERLEDQITVQNRHGTRSFAWSLRR